MDRFPDRTVFQLREWVQFLAETQHGTPIVAELLIGSEVVGYFTGLIVRRLGIRILGSSFPGWTTPYMGFNLIDGVNRGEALEAIERIAFRNLGCLHIEISDRNFTLEDGPSRGYEQQFYHTYETDLRRSEDELFSGMNSACRRCIRKAEKSGVSIQESHDLEFADEYFKQLQDVFDKQQLVPTYDVERVRALIRHLLPTGHLLLLRALSPEGDCIGTGIYPAFNKVAEFWGNASYRSMQNLRPNETLHWYAMRYWKARGIEVFDWGGGGDYKIKYGPAAVAVPWLVKSRFRGIKLLREHARQLFAMKQRLAHRFSGASRGGEKTEDASE